MYLLGILSLVVATAALPVLPDPPTLSNAALHQYSKSHKFQIKSAASASLRNVKDNEKLKKNMLKSASVAFSPPRKLSPFYDSFLKKQKAEKMQIYEDRVKQKAMNSEKENEAVIPEKSLEVEFLPDPGTVTNFKTGVQDCKVCANILIVTSDSAPVADKKDDYTVKSNTFKIPSTYIPTPRERFDFSILKNQTAQQKHKYYDVMKQEIKKSKKERKVILDQEKSALVEVPPNPNTFQDSGTASQDSEVRDIILSVTTDSTPVADQKDNEEVRHNMEKIATVVIPPPPELPHCDHAVLRQKIANQRQKFNNALKHQTKIVKEEKKVVIPHLENSFQVEGPTIPATFIESEVPPQNSEDRATVPRVTTDSTSVADKEYDENEKQNIVKIAPIVIPPPPELPHCDHAVLRQKIANQRQKYNNALKHQTKIFKEEKEVVIPHLENSFQVEGPTIPATFTESEVPPQNSEVRATVLRVATDSTPVAHKEYDENAKQNIVKIAPIVIPPPPELPHCDHAVLRQKIANQRQKYNNALKHQTKIVKEEKEVVIPHLENSFQVEGPTIPATFIESEVPPQNSEDRATVPRVTTDSTPVADKEYDENEKQNIVKIAPIVIPPPPELPHSDHAVLRQKIANQRKKYNNALKHQTKIFKEEKEVVIPHLENSFQVEGPTIPATFIESEVPPQNSEDRATVPRVTTDSTPVADKEYDENEKQNIVKIAPIVIPPPPELPHCDHAVLRQKIANQRQKYNNAPKHQTKIVKEEKKVVIPHLENSFQVEGPTIPATFIESEVPPQNSEVRATVLHVTTDSTPVADNEYDEDEKQNIATVVIPPPPELPHCDHAVLRQKIANQRQKYNNALKHQTKIVKEEKEVVIPHLENSFQVEGPTIPATFIESEVPPQNSEDRATVPRVTTDSTSVADKEYDENEKQNIVKIAPIVIPPPPELPHCDHTVLRQKIASQRLKYNNALKHHTKIFKEEKEVVIPHLENSFQVEGPTIPATFIESEVPPQNSEVRATVLRVTTDSTPVADNEYDEDEKQNIATVVIPPPPELPHCDHAVLRQKIANQRQKYNNALKHQTKIVKEEKEVVIPHLENSFQVEGPTIPATFIESEVPPQNSEDRATVPRVTTDSTSVADKEYDENEKQNIVKIAPIVIPPPPELPHCDHTVLRQKIASQRLKYNNALKHHTKIFKEEKEVVIPHLENSFQVEGPTIPATFIESEVPPQNSEVRATVLRVTTDSTPVADNEYDEDEKQNIATVVIPPPPELPHCDHAVLRQKIANQRQKYNNALKHQTKIVKEEKEVVIPHLENSFQVEGPTIPATFIESEVPPQNSEDRATVPRVTTDSTSVADKEYDENEKQNIVKIAPIVIPPPPELPHCDHTVLRQKIASQRLKYNNALKHHTKIFKEEKEVVIPHLENSFQVEGPTIPATFIESEVPPQNSEVRATVLRVTTDSTPVADKEYDENEKQNIVKIAPIVIPPPPELPHCDHAVLRQKIANQRQKYNNAPKHQTKIFKEEKEVVIPHLENSFQVEGPTIPATFIESEVPPQNSEVRATVLRVTTDSTPVADKEYDEDEKQNIATVVIPPPPELPPFDYSILRKQKTDLNLKSKYSAKQSAEKYKKDKETVILDYEKQVKVEVPPKPPTLRASVLKHPVSVEAKMNMGKVAPIVIPSPPELSQFDYSILKKQEAGKPKKENGGFVVRKPIKIEESKFVDISNPIEEFKPVEEFSPSEVLIKEPVKHSEDPPVVIQMTIPSAPFLSKLVSNCPPLPSLNGPFQKPSMSRCLINPKFATDGKMYAN